MTEVVASAVRLWMLTQKDEDLSTISHGLFIPTFLVGWRSNGDF